MQKELEQRIKEDEEDRAKDDEEAKQRAIREFELLQMGLEIRNSSKKGVAQQKVVGRENGKLILEEIIEGGDEAGSSKGKKRKFELDEEELMRIAREERQKAKTEISKEKEAASAAKLPSFWVPSLTPSVAGADIPRKELKLKPVCPASDKNKIHNISLKSLVTINFTQDDTDKDKHGETLRSCPSCKKALNNASRAMLAKPCGHVICKPCVDKFMRPQHDPHDPTPQSLRCYVCEADLTENKKSKKQDKDKVRPGLVLIESDGTGFTAGGGIVTAEKEGIAFQC